MSQNIPDESQTPTEQPTGADLLGKMTEAIGALNEAQEHLVDVAKDVAKHTTDPNAHGAATLANIAKALPTPVLEDGMFTFKDAAGKPLMEPVNIKGNPGEQGEKGDMPGHRWNGTSLQLQNPDGSWGEEQDLQGAKGEDGSDGAAPEHEWNGTSLKFKNPDGTWGEEQNLQGAKGEDGSDGAAPEHEWNGTSLKFKNPDGTWGEEQNLQGPQGAPGDAAIATAEQPGIVRPDGKTVTADDDGLLSALGGNLLLNSETTLTESGTWEASVTGWYRITAIGGGSGCWGVKRSSDGFLIGGNSGSRSIAYSYYEAGEEVDVVIGAGGIANKTPSNTWDNAVRESTYGGNTSFGDVIARCGSRVTDGESFIPGAFGGNYVISYDSGHTALHALSAGPAGPGMGGGGSMGWQADFANVTYTPEDGQPGAVYLEWHDPAKAAGPLPAPALLSARRMAGRAAAAVNLYDPETGQGSVWREEDAEAKLAEGLISQEAWLAICAEKAAEDYAVWLANPDTEAERFEMLRAARDARLAATDYLVAPDYPLDAEQRAAVTAYRQALRDLPAQDGAPWDGGGEVTPWPDAPVVSKVQVQPEEPEQIEDPEV